jgi:hypothetical protein
MDWSVDVPCKSKMDPRLRGDDDLSCPLDRVTCPSPREGDGLLHLSVIPAQAGTHLVQVEEKNFDRMNRTNRMEEM